MENQNINPVETIPSGNESGKKIDEFCVNCGAPLEEGQKFCPKCGHKIGLTINENLSSSNHQSNAGVNKQDEKKKKMPIILAVAVVIVVLLAVAGAKILPKIFIDSKGYLEQGNYEKAYEKAKTDYDRFLVKFENIVAVQSAFTADNLKNPSSFFLRDAYYQEVQNEDGIRNVQIVLYISASNSYGATISNYWLYTCDKDGKKCEYSTSVSDFSPEIISKYDDEHKRLKKLHNNSVRVIIKDMKKEGIKLSKEGVKRINSMFEADTLDDIEILDMPFFINNS